MKTTYLMIISALLFASIIMLSTPIQKATSVHSSILEDISNKVKVVKEVETVRIPVTAGTIETWRITLNANIDRSDLSAFPFVLHNIYVKVRTGNNANDLSVGEAIQYKALKIGSNFVECLGTNVDVIVGITQGQRFVASVAHGANRGALFPLGSDGSVSVTLVTDAIADNPAHNGFSTETSPVTVMFFVEAPEAVNFSTSVESVTGCG